MPRSVIRALAGSSAPLLALPLLACSGNEHRPAVILVSIDTLRADHVGAYGHARDTTPFLDRWAEQATVFERAFTTAAWTLVAHMTMLTGLFPEQHGVIAQRKALAPGIPLLAERLRAAGYRTIALYAPGWIHERHGFARGFDVFRAHQDLAEADAHLSEALAGLDRGQPFFLFLHLFDVHCGPFTEGGNSIYPAPPPYEHLFVDEDLAPLPDLTAKEIWWSRGLLGPEQFATAAALYDGGIRQVDDQLERWFGELQRRGLGEGALWIVTSDHGEALGQRGILDKHGENFQEGLHVPLIVRHPRGLRAGERVSVPVHLGDLVPTVLEACGLASDPRLPGCSLFGAVPEKRVIYGVKLPEAFVLRWPEKLVLGPKNACRAVDLERDPLELAPTAGAAERFHALRAEVMAGAEFPPALWIEELPAEERAELSALGYGGDDGAQEDSALQIPGSPKPRQ
jgi:arylsulfatase A-like enzyme